MVFAFDKGIKSLGSIAKFQVHRSPLSTNQAVLGGSHERAYVAPSARQTERGSAVPVSRRCFPRDLSWPKNPDFYENYKGHLSPVGCQMLVDTGRSFRTRYLEGSDLFKGIPQETLHKYVVAYTSNMQRTLFSAWSFLHGMFPDIPQYFSFATDRLKVNLKVRPPPTAAPAAPRDPARSLDDSVNLKPLARSACHGARSLSDPVRAKPLARYANSVSATLLVRSPSNPIRATPLAQR